MTADAIAAVAGQELEALRELGVELRQRERSEARRRELDGEGDAVELRHHLRQHRALAAGIEAVSHGAGTLAEELDGVAGLRIGFDDGERERLQIEQHLSVEMETLARGDDEARLPARAQPGAHGLGGGERDLLEVVEDEQRRRALRQRATNPQRGLVRARLAAQGQGECARDRRADLREGPGRREVAEDGAARVALRHLPCVLYREARLAHAPGTEDRHQAGACIEGLRDLDESVSSADEGRGKRRQRSRRGDAPNHEPRV